MTQSLTTLRLGLELLAAMPDALSAADRERLMAALTAAVEYACEALTAPLDPDSPA